jgi:hypothetical protein
MAPTVNLSKNFRFNGSIIPAIPIRETKNGQAQLTFALLVRFHQPKNTILWAFESLVNPKFLKISKFFHDHLAAGSDKGRDTTEYDARTQALFSKFFKKYSIFLYLTVTPQRLTCRNYPVTSLKKTC